MREPPFEDLAQRLQSILARIDSRSSLVRWASWLLKADLAILVDLAAPERKPVAVASHPSWEPTSIGPVIETLRGWYKDHQRHDHDFLGLSRREPLVAGGVNHADVLVAWTPPSFSTPYRFELLLCREQVADAVVAPFDSYDVWAASLLLGKFEAVEAATRAAELGARAEMAEAWAKAEQARAEAEEAQNHTLSMMLTNGLISPNVSPEEGWRGFADRGVVATDAWSSAEQAVFFIVNAAYWTVHRARRRMRLDRVGTVDLPHPDRDREAIDWLIHQRFLEVDDQPSPTRRSVRLGKLLLEANLDVTFSSADLVCAEAMAALKHLRDDPPPPEQESKGTIARLAVLAAETGLRTLGPMLHARGSVGRHAESEDQFTQLTGLAAHVLTLVGALARWLLQGDGYGLPDLGLHPGAPPPGDLGRESLRLYLVDRIASSTQICARYLGGPQSSDFRTAPVELRRQFLISLVRLLTWTTGIIEERLGLSADEGAVGATEVLDAQLHLVDRLVHVEFGVDERLSIRRILGEPAGKTKDGTLASEDQRDHLLHVMDVFLLGDVLLRCDLPWLGRESGALVKHLADLKPTASGGNRLSGRQADWFQGWAVASLLHDIGHQFRRLSLHNTQQGRPPAWTAFFKLPGAAREPSLVPPSSPAADGAVVDASDWLRKLARFLGSDEPLLPSWLDGIDPGSELISDHGVIGALRVAQLAAYFDSLNSASQPEDATLSVQLQAALHAIANHNLSNHPCRLSSEPLSCLLRLCDELHEWGRRRVNTGRSLKNLRVDLIDLHRSTAEALRRGSLLSSLRSNIVFIAGDRSSEGLFGANQVMRVSTVGSRPEAIPEDHGPEQREPERGPAQPRLEFVLDFVDSVEGCYDPFLTLLSKAWNLQHIDLAVDHQEGHKDLRWSVELVFPRPTEYGALTEYDIYGLFAEESRAIPLLHVFQGIDNVTEAGLIRLEGPHREPREEDRFGILIRRRAGASHRHGWLKVDPREHFDALLAFKERIQLLRRAGSG